MLYYKNMSVCQDKNIFLPIWKKMVSIVNKDLYINRNNIT